MFSRVIITPRVFDQCICFHVCRQSHLFLIASAGHGTRPRSGPPLAPTRPLNFPPRAPHSLSSWTSSSGWRGSSRRTPRVPTSWARSSRSLTSCASASWSASRQVGAAGGRVWVGAWQSGRGPALRNCRAPVSAWHARLLAPSCIPAPSPPAAAARRRPPKPGLPKFRGLQLRGNPGFPAVSAWLAAVEARPAYQRVRSDDQTLQVRPGLGRGTTSPPSEPRACRSRHSAHYPPSDPAPRQPHPTPHPDAPRPRPGPARSCSLRA
jgi:hypothetical protein